MDTLKSAMDDAAAECSLAVPALFATNTTDSYVQLKRYMYDAAKELLTRHDWANCTREQTVTGTGTDTYALAADFGRLTRRDEADEPAVWHASLRRRMLPVNTNSEWTVLTTLGGNHYGYRIVGSNIEFTENLATGDTVTVHYVSTGWIENASSRVATWAADADYTYLPAKLIELGATWRWRRKRGLEFASYQGEFEIEMTRFINDDRSIRKINMGPSPEKTSPYDGVDVPTLRAAS